MSDENKFGGSKKPRATFGDVMQGVPAGQGGEKSERPRPSVKPEKKDKGDSKPEKKSDKKPAEA